MKKIKVYFQGGLLITNQAEAYSLLDKIKFGERTNNLIKYSLFEAYYLLEKNKIEIYFKNKLLNNEEVLKKFSKLDKRFNIKYLVFRDLKDKGYILKTGLKFGADFRVYEKIKDVKESHSKWILYVDYETSILKLSEFSSKNRVAHSINKNLLFAIVDEEGDISYYETRWIKP
jgi:tRNA-intron endonuclease